LIEWKHVPGIEKLPANQGLNDYLRAQIEETFEIAVTSVEILWDLDTPEDYERLRQSGWGNIH
jgi:CTP:molybdopterin cytidylyltransferase MocA